MNREEVQFYFQSLRLLFVVMVTLQVGVIAAGCYLVFGNVVYDLSINGLDAEALKYFLILPLLAISSGSMLVRKKIAASSNVLGVEKKMAIYRKAMILSWILCVIGALIAGFIFASTKMVWVPAVNVMILVYFATTYTNPIKLAKQLKLTRDELLELESFYKKIN